MTGIDWLDTVAVTAFAAVTVIAVARLVRARLRGLDRLLGEGFHAVMGVAMTAMFWPGGGAWIAVTGLIVVWPVLVIALARRVRDPDAGAEAGARVGRIGRGPDRGIRVKSPREPGTRVGLGQIGYWAASTLVMAVGAGAAGHGKAGRGALMASMPMHSGLPSTGLAAGGLSPAGAGGPADLLSAAMQWPIWPAAGLGFAVYAVVLLASRRPITERLCAAVMAAGMALMAFAL